MILKFLLFALAQAMVINGIKGSFEKDMIFERVPDKVKRIVGEYWSKPIVGCIKCMSSFWGALTYWPTAIWVYGFRIEEIPVFVADVFILVYLNWYLYKRQ